MRTFIDIGFTIGLTALQAANEVKKYWRKYNVDLQINSTFRRTGNTKKY